MTPAKATNRRRGFTKVAHGTAAWFDMVGRVLQDAATQAKLAPDVHVCLVERYIDGRELGQGLVQGLRFEIVGGKPAFRRGARQDERGDITVEVTQAASHALNILYAADPRFLTTLADVQAKGEFTVDGDLVRLGTWFEVAHDRIVDRTM